jgi:hypothetical protein
MNTLNLKTVKKIILFFVLIALFNNVEAQVSNVTYSVKYNAETCLFDCYMNVNEGGAVSMKERVQFNAHYTLVVPSGSEVVIEEVYMPLRDNQRYRSTEPTDWFISSVIKSPAVQPQSEFYGIAPGLTPSAFYNDIRQGDEVKLFSVSISPMVDCAKGVRLYDHDSDPTSSDLGMGGSDFSHGFTMGGLEQLYGGNEEVVYPQEPTIYDLVITKSAKSSEVSVSSIGLNCNKSISYQWVDPHGNLIQEGSNAKINIRNAKSGEYSVIATDGIGCKTSKSFNITEESTLGISIIDDQEEIISSHSTIDVVYNSTIYPNPAKDVINFTFNGNKGDAIKADLVDQSGKVIIANAINDVLSSSSANYLIPVEVSSGVYSLSLTVNDTKLQAKRVIIIE